MATEERDVAGASSVAAELDGIGLLDALPDGLVITDRSGTITSVNERAAALFGSDVASLVGRPIEELLPEAQRQVHRAHRLRYAAAPRVRPMGTGLQLWGLRADGAEFPLEISLSPWRSEAGERFVAVVRDVSARHQAEAELRTVHDLLDRVSEAVHVLEAETLEIVYANEGAVQLSGYDRRDLVGMTPLHLLPECDEEALRRWVSAGSGAPLLTSLRTRQGIDRPVECRLDAPPPARGRPPRLVLMARDISARLAEEEERRAAQRLAALADDRERIARDLHDTAIQELFATGLGLQGAAMHAPPELRDRLLAGVEHLDAVIRQIRAAIFSMSQRREGDSLTAALTALVAEGQRSLGFRPVLELDGPLDTLASVEVAEDLLASVREALSNVARHARATRVQVTVAANVQAITVTVLDDGQGPPPGAGAVGGRGLRNLAARAERHGGTATLAGGPGATSLTWSVPV